MSKQKNNDVIRENGLGFLQVGDYFIPDLKLPQENRSIGKYGRMHRDYLQEHNPIRFDDLVLAGKLWTYLADLNEQAQNRLQLIIRQMQEAESVNDELKEKNQLAWVQAMNSIHNRAEEIVLHELVYGEDA
ncbi:MAG: TnpV protein [Frisingicoccus sp.]|uniref:TnpV protein n=1 Tax=Frisingicoccus sp. TaxID=1918627 RepID=UPI002A7EE310|nr:TnpV protein [Frisingicoccus sp.]MDY4834350.1 TnpV protein [Frisingicoccus sp.]